MEIIEAKRKDGQNGNYRIRIQPPDIKLSTNYGVLININDHLNVEDKNPIKLFTENWNVSFNKANEICDSLWEKIKN